MLETIGAALGLVSTTAGAVAAVTTTARGIVDLVRGPEPDIVEIKRLASLLLDEIIDAKARQMELKDTLLKLQDEAKKRDHFAHEARRYALTQTDMGAMVYALVPDHARGEPVHYLCTSCFEADVKSVLQPGDRPNTLACPRCGSRFLKSDGRGEVLIGRVNRGVFDDL